MVRFKNVIYHSFSCPVRNHIECQIHNEQVDVACRMVKKCFESKWLHCFLICKSNQSIRINRIDRIQI